MGRIGNQHACALCFAVIFVIFMDDQRANQLALSTGSRLERYSVESGDFFQHFLQGVHQVEVALNGFNRLERMGKGKTGQAAGYLLILGLYFIVQEPSGRNRGRLRSFSVKFW